MACLPPARAADVHVLRPTDIEHDSLRALRRRLTCAWLQADNSKCDTAYGCDECDNKWLKCVPTCEGKLCTGTQCGRCHIVDYEVSPTVTVKKGVCQARQRVSSPWCQPHSCVLLVLLLWAVRLKTLWGCHSPCCCIWQAACRTPV